MRGLPEWRAMLPDQRRRERHRVHLALWSPRRLTGPGPTPSLPASSLLPVDRAILSGMWASGHLTARPHDRRRAHPGFLEPHSLRQGIRKPLELVDHCGRAPSPSPKHSLAPIVLTVELTAAVTVAVATVTVLAAGIVVIVLLATLVVLALVLVAAVTIVVAAITVFSAVVIVVFLAASVVLALEVAATVTVVFTMIAVFAARFAADLRYRGGCRRPPMVQRPRPRARV